MNRAAIFVFYDKDGIVDRYIIYLLEELLKVANKLIVVCNGRLSPKGKQDFEKLTPDVFVRKNEGFDAWGFKAGIEHLGWGNLSQYDELILINDTVYGPFYPFNLIFDEMEKRNLDFWGITKHNEFKNEYRLTKEVMLPAHIQSYFFVIGKKMFLCPDFKVYWDNLRPLRTRVETICFHELRFTKYFSDKGFTWDAYVNTDNEFGEHADFDLLLLMTYELLANYKLPVIKRKILSEDYTNCFGRTAGDRARKSLDYIRNKTEYDTDLIWENILRTMRLKNVKDNLHLNYVLAQDRACESGINLFDAKISLFIYLSHEDQVELFASYASAIPANSDIVVTTHSAHIQNIIVERFKKINCNKVNAILLPEKRGGSLSALWVMLKPYMLEYDLICFIHDDDTFNQMQFTVGRGFTYKCLENMLTSKEYVINILSLFRDNPRLGMLFPPPAVHGSYQYNLWNLWGANYQNTVELAKKLGIAVPMDKRGLVFPSCGMFWFRPKSLEKMIDYDWKFSDFPSEPLSYDGTLCHSIERVYCFAAQSAGYYSAWIMTDYFAAIEITSLSYLTSQSSHVVLVLKNFIKYKLRRHQGLLNFAYRCYRSFKKQ